MEKIWFAVDKDLEEWWFSEEPIKNAEFGEWLLFGNKGKLFPGAIKMLTGKELTWNDELIKIEL